jgi:hypothetical protein
MLERMIRILPLLLLAGCATSYDDVQQLPPIRSATTAKPQAEFVACYLPAVLNHRTGIRVTDEGQNKVIANHSDLFGMTGFSVTVTPAGLVTMRHGQSIRAFEPEWQAAVGCL